MNQDQALYQNHLWILTVRGIAAILFGLAAIFWPGLTLLVLVYLFSALVLVTGITTLILSLTHLARHAGTTFGNILGIVLGIVEIGVGVYLLRHPDVSFTTFILLIGAALIIRGVFEVIAGLLETENAAYKTLTIVGGVAATLAGIIILFQPVEGGVAFVWILGLYALIVGPLLVAVSLSARHEEEEVRSNGRRRGSRSSNSGNASASLNEQAGREDAQPARRGRRSTRQ